MKTSFAALVAALTLILPTVASDRAQAPSVSPVCGPSWGTISVPICL